MRGRSCILTAALALSLGCNVRLSPPRGDGTDAPPQRGGVLRIASLGEIRTLDPAATSDSLGAQAERLLFAGLIGFDEKGRAIPDLAESWEIRPDGLEYLFHLRPHSLFHDGTEVTGADIKRSMERALDAATPNPYSSRFEGIEGYEAFVSGKKDALAGVISNSRYDVTFRLSRADSAFLSSLSLNSARPVCPSGGRKYDDKWVPCGAGPYILREGDWARDTSLRLTRSLTYGRPGRAWVDAIEWTFNLAPLPQRIRFERGELDILVDLTQSEQARFRSDPRWAPFGQSGSDSEIHGEGMNTEMPPFDNVEVRRAVASAIDRTAYRLLRPANATIITGPLLPGLSGSATTKARQTFDYAAALGHMRRAGLPFDPASGTGGYPKTISYVVPARSGEEAYAQILAQQLDRIGLHLDLRPMNSVAFLWTTHRRRSVALAPQGWELDTWETSELLDPLFGTAAISENDSSNTSFYSNSRVDELLLEGHRERNGERREAVYAQASDLIVSDAPWAFTYAIHKYVIHQPRVHGLAFLSSGSLDLASVWLTDHAETLAPVTLLEKLVAPILPHRAKRTKRP